MILLFGTSPGLAIYFKYRSRFLFFIPFFFDMHTNEAVWDVQFYWRLAPFCHAIRMNLRANRLRLNLYKRKEIRIVRLKTTVLVQITAITRDLLISNSKIMQITKWIFCVWDKKIMSRRGWNRRNWKCQSKNKRSTKLSCLVLCSMSVTGVTWRFRVIRRFLSFRDGDSA